ncbi:MAG: 4-hydroxy-tetrahydrodipicolinate synthase, partial [Vicinamibacteria bacterium]|nr:4-hydroxy-tetrahydrodipicolinate synthase [Vicinamibacteria bacterium]
ADFSGLSVALATPFTSAGELDMKAFRALVRHVAGGGADVLVVLGSTGEAATIAENERDPLIAATLEEAGGKKVVAGTGHNSTRQTVAWTKRAQELGAHGALIVTPFYNKPTPQGLVAHFRAAAEAAPGLPFIVYNVPGRTGLNLTPAALQLLWENEQVVAVKESSGNVAQIGEIARALPAGKTLLSGDDNLALASLAVGAEGLVSVLGNMVPKETKQLVEAAKAGRRDEAIQLNNRLLPLIDALFLESNPIPLKAGLQMMGLGGDFVRLPLVPASEATRARLKDALAHAGVRY